MALICPQFKLGASLATMQDTVVLFGIDPNWWDAPAYMPGAELVNTTAGTHVPVGYPRARWHFPSVKMRKFDDARILLCGATGWAAENVYVRTIDGGNNWGNYRAVVRFPDTSEYDKQGDVLVDAFVEFVLVEAL